jgi:eukaryotic-like serine/threonine-protein kinase
MNEPGHELIGRTLGGRFRLTGFLGEGAMASVFRGEQDAEPREVAVKIMRPELLRDAAFAKRFTREAKAAARIEHPNTVRILEHGADGELLYLAMELCAGQDLFDVLARERRLPEARAARIVTQICSALTAAHAHGIVHRDLKPENVMIVSDPAHPGADLVKVLDFGIAKILERERREDEEPTSRPVDSAPPSSALTMVGALVGTPEYMSPEQSRGMPIDARSDIYACGVLLFHIVTGKQPFTGQAAIDVLMQHSDKAPPAPSSILPGIHAGLEKVILKALAKGPEARQQSAVELGDELTALLPELASMSRRGPALVSESGASLLGVPAAVMIKEPAAEPEASPDTMRSPPQASDLEKGAIVETPAALVADAPVAVAMLAIHEGAFPPEPRPRPRRPSEASEASEALVAAKSEPVVAADPPREERRPLPAAPSPASAADEWIVPPWVFVLVVAVGSGLIWLVHYLRFG